MTLLKLFLCWVQFAVTFGPFLQALCRFQNSFTIFEIIHPSLISIHIWPGLFKNTRKMTLTGILFTTFYQTTVFISFNFVLDVTGWYSGLQFETFNESHAIIYYFYKDISLSLFREPSSVFAGIKWHERVCHSYNLRCLLKRW